VKDGKCLRAASLASTPGCNPKLQHKYMHRASPSSEKYFTNNRAVEFLRLMRFQYLSGTFITKSTMSAQPLDKSTRSTIPASLCARCEALVVQYFTQNGKNPKSFDFRHGKRAERHNAAIAGCPICNLSLQVATDGNEDRQVIGAVSGKPPFTGRRLSSFTSRGHSKDRTNGPSRSLRNHRDTSQEMISRTCTISKGTCRPGRTILRASSLCASGYRAAPGCIQTVRGSRGRLFPHE
jgi:hypothetical protein